MRRSRRGPLRRIDDDAGAIAIMVALLLSSVLIGFGAFAVDLGNLYVRKANLRSAADLAAIAGATQLPNMAKARQQAIDTLCSPANLVPGTDQAWCSDPALASNGNLADGEISFFTEDRDGDGIFDHELITGSGSAPAVAIRVQPPPANVKFGLAAAWGFASGTTTAAATARIGTPAGVGILPFPVMSTDLSAANSYKFCVRDTAATSTKTPITDPGPAPSFFFHSFAPTLTLAPNPIDGTVAGSTTLTIGLAPFTFGAPLPTTGLTVHLWNPATGTAVGPLPAPTSASATQIVLTVPHLAPGSYLAWVDGYGPWFFNPHTQIVSNLATLTVSGGASLDPCDRPDAGRGVLNVARFNGVADLSQNVASGVQAGIHRFDQWPPPPLATTPALTNVLTGVSTPTCSQVAAAIGAGSVDLRKSVPGDYAPQINCADLRRSGFSADLTTGLLDAGASSPGRLTLSCSTQRTVDHGWSMDDTQLFAAGNVTSGNDLISNSGDGHALQGLIESGATPTAGYITDKAFQCPRLGLVPIMNPQLVAPSAGTDDAPIIGYAYAWIDNDDGLAWQSPGNRVAAVRLHVIDPGYFSPLVSGSPVVTQWLGPDLPKQVVLVRDESDPTP